MSNEYKIVFRGDIIPPTNLQTAKRRLSLLLDVPLQAVQHIFNGQTYILKEHLHESQIQVVKDSLAKMGLNVECIRMVIQAPMKKAKVMPNSSSSHLTDKDISEVLFSFASYLAQPSLQQLPKHAKQLIQLDHDTIVPPLQTALIRSSASVIASSARPEKKQMIKVMIQTKKTLQ